MREVHVDAIIETVKRLCIEANIDLNQEMIDVFKRYREVEESPAGKAVLDQLLKNAEIARAERMPICQDTGLAVFLIELGQEVHIVGGDFDEAVNEGVRRGYKEGYLRNSAAHPFSRKNTGDNTPAVIHLSLVPGDKIKILFAPKGGGAENMSSVTMLAPAAGREGVINHVVEQVRKAGSNPCPPTVVGVGVGGTFERSAFLAKKALFRPLGQPNPDPEIAEMEKEMLDRINRLGIGPQGLGGRVTSLAVHMEIEPVHIASLPVAVNIDCHAHRHKEAEI